MHVSVSSFIDKIIYNFVEITTNESSKNSIKDAKITIFGILNKIYSNF